MGTNDHHHITALKTLGHLGPTLVTARDRHQLLTNPVTALDGLNQHDGLPPIDHG
jgi:hypothetical protein